MDKNLEENKSFSYFSFEDKIRVRDEVKFQKSTYLVDTFILYNRLAAVPLISTPYCEMLMCLSVNIKMMIYIP